MSHYECPLKQHPTNYCFHKEPFVPGDAPDEYTPSSSDLAHDAMITHLTEVHGIPAGPEADYMVYEAYRKAVA